MIFLCRDVSGVELLMNNHQSLKAEVDAREDNFNVCVSLGKELLARNHYATPEIKEKLMSLTNQRVNMLNRWEERWEHLQLSKTKTRFCCPSHLSKYTQGEIQGLGTQYHPVSSKTDFFFFFQK